MHLGQARRAEDGVVVAREAVNAFHRRADLITHLAARAVGADQIERSDRLLGAGLDVADMNADAGLVLLERQELLAEGDGDRGQAARMVEQHLFQFILRNPLAVLGIALVLRRRTLQAIVEAGDQLARKPGHKGDVCWIVDAERRGGGQFVGNPPAAQMLAGPRVSRLGPRSPAGADVALQDQAGNRPAAELDRER